MSPNRARRIVVWEAWGSYTDDEGYPHDELIAICISKEVADRESAEWFESVKHLNEGRWSGNYAVEMAQETEVIQ